MTVQTREYLLITVTETKQFHPMTVRNIHGSKISELYPTKEFMFMNYIEFGLIILKVLPDCLGVFHGAEAKKRKFPTLLEKKKMQKFLGVFWESVHIHGTSRKYKIRCLNFSSYNSYNCRYFSIGLGKGGGGMGRRSPL